MRLVAALPVAPYMLSSRMMHIYTHCVCTSAEHVFSCRMLVASAVHCQASRTSLVSVEGSPIRASLSSTSSLPPMGAQVGLLGTQFLPPSACLSIVQTLHCLGTTGFTYLTRDWQATSPVVCPVKSLRWLLVLCCHCPCSHMRRVPCTTQRGLCQHAACAGQGPLGTPGSQCQPRAAAQRHSRRPSLHPPPARCEPL